MFFVKRCVGSGLIELDVPEDGEQDADAVVGEAGGLGWVLPSPFLVACRAPRLVLGLHPSRYERQLLKRAADLGVEAIATSFNSLGFRAHKTLAEVAGDLLPKFSVSTNAGYFPTPGGSEHSLDPNRLRAAVERAARDLGRAPNLVFLHNPEQSLTGLAEGTAHHQLTDAFAALADAVAHGLCGA